MKAKKLRSMTISTLVMTVLLITNYLLMSKIDVNTKELLIKQEKIVAVVDNKLKDTDYLKELSVAKKTKKIKKNKTLEKKSNTVVSSKKMSGNKTTPVLVSGSTGNAVVEYAKQFVGLKYVYGGNSLETGTDCSGFTKLIYSKYGVSLGRTVSAQINQGVTVSKNNLQKGDLIFYGKTSSKATHVAIYIGDGMIVHESTPKDGCKIASVNIMNFITAKRVLKGTTVPVNEEITTEEITSEEIASPAETEVVTETSTEVVESTQEIETTESVITTESITTTEISIQE